MIQFSIFTFFLGFGMSLSAMGEYKCNEPQNILQPSYLKDGALFSDINSYPLPPVTSMQGIMPLHVLPYQQQLIEELNSTDEGFRPSHPFNRSLLGSVLPFKKMVSLKELISAYLPTFGISDSFRFDLVDKLNQAHLHLSPDYFLKSKDHRLDTALSFSGLRQLMTYYGELKGVTTYVMNSQEDASNFIRSGAVQYPSVMLMTLDSFRRHVTGIYFTVENHEKKAYIFDSIGITFPAYPCGSRYRSTELPINIVLGALGQTEHKLGIMPINMAMAMQKDRYSCLIMTLFFFELFQKEEYKALHKLGIVDTWGEPILGYEREGDFFIHGLWDVELYTLTSSLILAGLQSRLTFLYMLDPLEIDQEHLRELMKLQTDWTDLSGNNVFFQAAYVKLLEWFDACVQAQTVQPWPDFEGLLQEGPNRHRLEQSGFEKRLMQE